ncbi:MAG: NPCBM/NEW2 domain-containing protein [Thermoguttaceae bacterium]
MEQAPKIFFSCLFALLSFLLILSRFDSASSSLSQQAFSQESTKKTIYLDELDLSNTECGWQQTSSKKSVAGNQIRLRGKTYERGIGHHSKGRIQVSLPQISEGTFYSVVGIDDEVGNNGHAEFLVYGDGKLLWRSGFLTGKDEPKTCSVSIAGLKRLTLVLDDGPEGYSHDHGDWADAKFELTGISAANNELTGKIKTEPLIGSPIYDNNGMEVDRMNENACEFLALGEELKKGIAPFRVEQTYRVESTFFPSDRDPVDIVLRRTRALLNHLRTLSTDEKGAPDLIEEEKALDALDAKNKEMEVTDDVANIESRHSLFAEATSLREKIALQNPLIDFDKILFIKRHFNPEPEKTGNHMCDQFFGFHARPGGGIFILEHAFDPEKRAVRNVFDDTSNAEKKGIIQSGRLTGRKFDSTWGFLSPELSFDGKKMLFAASDTMQPRHSYTWNEDNCYHIFECDIDGSNVKQITDGAFEDFDPCYLPNGRIIFISSRRGGFGRCHGRAVPSYTLHSMNSDGSDITMLSPHETNEWAPSVGNNGMVLYTRWDYVDRGFNQAHHPWTTFPDGRDPRAIHGNTSDVEQSRPQFETSIRAVPNSSKLVGTSAMHHGQYFGSILLIDLNAPDDDSGGAPMTPVRRVTPEQLFPEVENRAHKDSANYGQPFPISDDYYLVVYDAFSGMGKGEANNYGLYLLDAFGNKVLLYRDPLISVQCPIPLKPRPVPPAIPHQVLVGVPLQSGEVFEPTDHESLPKTGVVGVIDVNRSIRPFPEGAKPTELRVVQLLPKTNHIAHDPPIGYGDQKGARKILGTVPIQEDGSVRFELPVDVPVYFQLLDENGVAIQSMRSATYVKPGETLTCIGCHEGRQSSAIRQGAWKTAFRRSASIIKPEMSGTNPFSYPILIQPILDKNCVECHAAESAAGKTFPLDRGDLSKHFYTSFENLRPFVFFFNNAAFTEAKTMPGKFGANASKLWKILEDGHHDVNLTKEEKRALALWMDNNGDFYGSYEHENLKPTRLGEIVCPTLE